ncbi:unnamed protein product [Closterium sp. NIES-54]
MPSPDPPAPALDDQQRATCTLSTPDPARPSLEQRTESQGAVSSEPGETQRRESLRSSPSSSSEASQQQRQQEQPPQQEEKENRPQQQHHHNPSKSAAGERGNPNLGVSATASAAASEPSDSDRLSDGALPLSPEHSVELLREVARYNRLFGGVPVSLWQRILDMPLLLSRLGRDLTDPLRALRLLHNARMVFCVAIVFVYVLSPFDLIPEFAMGIVGLLDDFLLLLCLAFYLSLIYRHAVLAAASVLPAGPTSSIPFTRLFGTRDNAGAVRGGEGGVAGGGGGRWRGGGGERVFGDAGVYGDDTRGVRWGINL